MNPLDILDFLTPNFSDLLQTSFFIAMLAMLLLTVVSVHFTASANAWEKKWNRASNSKSGVTQGIEQGGVTDLFHIVATRPEKLAEVMPGMLLIVGLLGTFIGLGLALDKASSILGASNAMDAAGAADGLQNMLGMLKGLGTKFKTSTWGITGFILMKVWSEVSQFEEKRLAWVIGKAKKETEIRTALLLAADKEKWERSVKLGKNLGGAITTKLADAFKESIEKFQQAATDNHRENIAKSSEFYNTQIAALTTLFHGQTKAMNEQQTQNMRESTRVLGEKLQLMANASEKTSIAMQDFTDKTQTIISNMSNAANRMASGADDVGKAATNLLGAVNKFEKQFTEVLDNVRKDLGQAITDMSSQAAKTLETGSQKLSESTIQISKSLEQLSSDVTGTMTKVQESIKQALNIQEEASKEIIASSHDFRTGIHEITGNIGKLSRPIEEGLASISKSNVQMNNAVKKMTDGFNLANKASEDLSALTSNISNFEGIPPAIDKLISSLAPIKNIHASLDEFRKQISNRPATETSIARDINKNLKISLSPLNQIHSLLMEIRSDLTNRSLLHPGVAPRISQDTNASSTALSE